VESVAKPAELLALYDVTEELFDTLKRWFSVPDRVPLDLSEIDSAVSQLGDPVAIAALAMRKLQALRLLSQPGVRTSTDVVVSSVQDLGRALVQAPTMRLHHAAEAADWDAELAALVLGGQRTSVAVRLLIAAFGVQLVTDTIYLTETAAGSYVGGCALDTGWLLTYSLIAAAALHPTMAAGGRPQPSRSTEFSALQLIALTLPIVLAHHGALSQVTISVSGSSRTIRLWRRGKNTSRSWSIAPRRLS
jgi:hypothetical protein